MCELLPPKLHARLEAFMKAGSTGKVELDIKDGSVAVWHLHESHREKP